MVDIPVVLQQPTVASGGDLSTALIVIGAVLLGVLLLPLLLALLEPPKVEHPRHVSHRRFVGRNR